MPLGEQAAQRGGRFDRNPLADMQAGLAADRVEPGRDRSGRVPYRVARNRDGQRRECGNGNDAREDETPPDHDSSALRWSHAR